MPLGRPKKSEAESSPRGLTGSAEFLSERLATGVTTVEPSWQHELWNLYDAVPELRTVARITAVAMSQCRLVIAKVSNEGEPSPLDPDEEHPAKDLLAQFAGGPGGQTEFLEQMGIYFTVTGEGIAVGSLDPALGRIDDFMRMKVYAPAQVRSSTGKDITIQMDQTTRSNKVIPADDQSGAVAIRIWRKHPRRSWEADSAGRAALPILREILLYDAHLRATALSRLSGAGLLFVPDGMTLPEGPPQEQGGGSDADPFMLLLMEIMGTAIKDQESAAAKVPVVIRADGEEIAQVRWMQFSTAFDEKVKELRDAATDRLGVTADMPPEMLKGLGNGLQHWTASLVTNQWVSTYLAELMATLCGSLTTGWLYPALAAQAKRTGTPVPQSDVIIWFDASSIRTQQETAANAKDLYDRKVIGPDTLRRSSNFDEGDTPTPTELLFMLYMEAVKYDPSILPEVAAQLGLTPEPNAVAPTSAPGTPRGTDPAALPRPAVPQPGTAAPQPGTVEHKVLPQPPGGAPS